MSCDSLCVDLLWNRRRLFRAWQVLQIYILFKNCSKLLEPQKIDPNAKSFSEVTKPAIGVGFVSSNSEVAGAAAVWILFYPIFLRSEREGVG